MSETTPKDRTTTQYRVVSLREDGTKTVKTYAHLKAVKDRIGRLTSAEPWRFYGSDAERQRDGSDLECCDGRECGCGGQTVKEASDGQRSGLTPVVSVEVSTRRVTRTAWVPVPDEPKVAQ